MHNPNHAPLCYFTQVPGWESPDEQATLFDFAHRLQPGQTIVEVGSEFGMSASIFCAAAPIGTKIFSVDIFPGSLLDMHRANLAEAKLAGRSKQLKGDSSIVGRAWTLGGIDLLFIDGDHSYAGVKRDIEAWIPHVRAHGIVIFHDAMPPTNKHPHADGIHAEVDQAINDWLMTTIGQHSSWTELPPVDSMRIFQRSDMP